MLLIDPIPPHTSMGPHLGMGIISACAKKAGIEKVEFIDGGLEHSIKGLNDHALERAGHHDIIGLTCNVQSMPNAHRLGKQLKQRYPDKLVIMGGPYASVTYDSILPEAADIVVIGEGEITIQEILSGKPLDQIPGIAYYDDGIQLTKPRELLEDLDSLPLPDMDIYQVDKYRVLQTGRRFMVTMTSRGCIYNCANCYRGPYPRKMRTRSIDSIMNEIDMLYNDHGIREIHLYDDLLTYRFDRLYELSERLGERQYDLKFAVLNGLKADLEYDEFFRRFSEVGLYYITVAVESGDQNILNRLSKKTDISKAYRTCETARKYGIQVLCFYMWGTPWDTPESLKKTIEFAVSLPCDYAQFYMAVPFKGTGMRMIVEKKGKMLQDPDILGSVYNYGKPFFEMPQLPAEVTERLYKVAYQRFYMRPRIIINFLKRVLKSPIRRDYFAEFARHYWNILKWYPIFLGFRHLKRFLKRFMQR